MAKFITNINLQDGNQLDYDRLQKKLGKESFFCKANPVKTKSFISGQGVFFREGSITIQEVTSAVIRATCRTWKKYSFYVLKDKMVSGSNQ
ncbi:MAG: hypothetical protein ABIN89_17340 [Chitinophagaceae bacterium]